MSQRSYDYLFNIAIIGDTTVGKSCLFMRTNQDLNFEWGSDMKPTIGVDFRVIYQDVNNKNVRLHVWDTSGHERFKNITRSYFRGAHGFLLTYDITNRESFFNIKSWLEDAKNYSSELTEYILIGNCCDLEDDRQVSYEEGREFAKSHNFPFFEVSAKTTENIKPVVKTLTEKILYSRRRRDGDLKISNTDDCTIFLKKDSKLQKKEGSKKCFSS